jgi:hypothetical protein
MAWPRVRSGLGQRAMVGRDKLTGPRIESVLPEQVLN